MPNETSTPSLPETDLERIWSALRVPSRELPANPAGCNRLMQLAWNLLPHDPSETSPPLALALPVALTLLGPHGRAPADTRLATLQGLPELAAATSASDVFDLVTAYGCGLRREIAPGANGWDGRWDRALEAIHALVYRFVKDAFHQLEKIGLSFPHAPDIAGAADLLLVRLVRPLSPLLIDEAQALCITCTDEGTQIEQGDAHEEFIPAGAKGIYRVRHDHPRPPRLLRDATELSLVPDADTPLRVTAMDFETRITLTAGGQDKTLKLAPAETVRLVGPANLDILECTCGHRLCAERHRLDGWRPADGGPSLASFVASAVKGPGRVVRTGSFQQGMLFALWSREGF